MTFGKRVHEIMKTKSNQGGKTLSTRVSQDFCSLQSGGRGICKDDKKNMLRRPTSTVFQEGVRAETRRPFSGSQGSDVRRSESHTILNSSQEESGSDIRHKGKRKMVEGGSQGSLSGPQEENREY